MTSIADDYMREMMQATKPYTIVILHKTSIMNEPGAGRRNFELRRDGILCVVCPVRDESDIGGVGTQILKALDGHILEMTLPHLVYSIDGVLQTTNPNLRLRNERDQRTADETAALVEEIATDAMAESFSSILQYFLSHPHLDKLFQALVSRVDQLLSTSGNARIAKATCLPRLKNTTRIA